MSDCDFVRNVSDCDFVRNVSDCDFVILLVDTQTHSIPFGHWANSLLPPRAFCLVSSLPRMCACHLCMNTSRGQIEDRRQTPRHKNRYLAIQYVLSHAEASHHSGLPNMFPPRCMHARA